MNLYLHLSTNEINPVWAGQNISYEPSTDGMHATLHLSSLQSYAEVQRAARSLANSKYEMIYLAGNNWNLHLCIAFAKGVYKPYKSIEVKYPELEQEEQHKFQVLLNHHLFLRNLINEPSETLTPAVLVDKAKHVIKQAAASRGLQKSLAFKIVKGEELKKDYPGIYTVGRGSVNHPYYLRADFNPSGKADAEVALALVGKGITFDTGGYSLKPDTAMATMRSDMGGSALVIAAFAQAIASGLNKRVVMHIGCAENMISGNAFVLGHIIDYPNGVKAEVNNTDAEGRLVLADCLIQAGKDNPQKIIDIATLTGAAKTSVGTDYHSVLSMDNDFVELLLKSAKENGERFWRLPFEEFHRGQIKSAFADINNIASEIQVAGASTATAFLSYFVPDFNKNWLHIDASSTFNRRGGSAYWATGATGIGLETLSHLINNL